MLEARPLIDSRPDGCMYTCTAAHLLHWHSYIFVILSGVHCELEWCLDACHSIANASLSKHKDLSRKGASGVRVA